MAKLVSGLYRLARIANDISKVASGDPKKIIRRIKNKWMGTIRGTIRDTSHFLK